MAIQQPGPTGGIQGRGVSPRCGQGGHRSVGQPIGAARGGLHRKPIFSSKQSVTRFGVSGITKDAAGATLPNCTVDLYSESRVWLARTVSDGSGAYAFTGVGVGSVFVVAYLDGAPDVAGTTIRNIPAVPV